MEPSPRIDTLLKRSIRERCARHRPRLRYDGSLPFPAWKDAVVEGLREVLRFREGPPAIEARVENRVEFRGCIREKVWIRTEESLEVPCYLFLPPEAGRPAPAILCPHGHGHGKIEISGEQASRYGSRTDYGLLFALAGYITLCPDHRGFGELSYETCGGEESWLSWLYHTTGDTLQGKRVYDLSGCVDYLLTRPEVDPDRIGVAGLSLGGEMALYLALLDPRIRAAVTSGFVRDVIEEVVDVHHCACTFSPGLFEFFDLPDLAGAIAPLPLLIQTGRLDTANNTFYTGRGKERVVAAYKDAGAPENLALDLHDSGHEFLMEKPLEFLRRHLG